LPIREGDAVPDALASGTISDHDGRRISIRTFWTERPALLIFIRHFG